MEAGWGVVLGGGPKNPYPKDFLNRYLEDKGLGVLGVLCFFFGCFSFEGFFSLAKLLKGFPKGFSMGFFEATKNMLLKRLRYRRES